MQSETHKKHIQSRVSHSDCSECRADTERQFVSVDVWRYQFISDYLKHVKPRLAAIRAGALKKVNAQIWYREYQHALDRRISLKATSRKVGRKHCHSYLERLGMALAGRKASAAYLRSFAQRGASCLDW